MTLPNTVTDNRGIATSLIETVVVVVIVAIIAGVAVGAGLDRIDDARVAQAVRDTELIGMAAHSFMQDTGLPPAFKSGLSTSPTDEIFFVLETEGEDAEDKTNTWPTEADERDLIENHLMMNQPDGSAPSYLRVGEISFNRQKGWNGPYLTRLPVSDPWADKYLVLKHSQKGWNGPYLTRLPVSDPWADKYLVNVQFFTPQGVNLVREDLTIPTGGRVAVVVLSAGANRTIETRFDQLSESFTAVGDDIIFRMQ